MILQITVDKGIFIHMKARLGSKENSFIGAENDHTGRKIKSYLG
jgi:hypothetical protein